MQAAGRPIDALASRPRARRSPLPDAATALALKLALFGMVLYGATHRDLPELGGRTTTARLVVYPAIALGVPAAWWTVGALLRRRFPYPAAVEVLVTLPFVIDLAATILGLRNRETWWAETAHFTYWALLAAAFGALLLPLRLRPLVAAGLVLGFGATIAIVWEALEYVTLHHDPATRLAEYSGTIRDLTLALMASLFAAVATLAGARARRAILTRAPAFRQPPRRRPKDLDT